jgi:polar amino acid transport system substrate-binding protein
MLSRRALLGFALACAARPADAAERPAPLAPEIERIVARGRLIVATAGFDLPPFVTAGNDGAPTGDDIELARGMAAALGVAIAFAPAASTADLLDLLARGAADLAVAGLSVTLDRARRVRFSRPYLVLRQALLLNRPRLAPLLHGRGPLAVLNEPEATIAVVQESAYAEYATRTLPRAHLVAYPRWLPDMVEAVLRGEVLAGYGDERAVAAALASRSDGPLQLRSLILGDERDAIAVALPWASLQLAAWVDLYLETVATPRPRDAEPATDAPPRPPKPTAE